MNNAGLRRAGRPGRFGARAVPAVVLVVAATAASTGISAGAEPASLLPDLVADPVTRPLIETYAVPGQPDRLLLRFDGYVHNRGTGAAELRGSERNGDEMGLVRQRVYDSGGGHQDLTNTPAPRIVFEAEDGHDHWHLRRAAQYSLQGSAGEVAAQKVGFCLVDSQRMDSWGPTSRGYSVSDGRFCDQYNPTASSVTMGVSAGWRDTYHRNLAFQWVDISDVQPGPYRIRSDVDPGNVIVEADEDNRSAFVDATVPGYVATDVSAPLSTLLPSSSVSLRADKFASPGAPQFRIDEAPKNGTLNKDVGEWFDGSSVTYTPRQRGSSEPDSFKFSARDANNPSFPLNPRSATARLGVGGGSGGPLPLGAQTAASSGSSMAESAVAGPRRAPDVSQPLPVPDGGLVAVPQVELRHGDLIARTIPWRSGTVRISMLSADGSSESCAAGVPAGQPFACLLASGVSAGDVAGTVVFADVLTAGRVLGSRATVARP